MHSGCCHRPSPLHLVYAVQINNDIKLLIHLLMIQVSSPSMAGPPRDNRQQTTDTASVSQLAANSDSYAGSTPVDAGRINLPDLAWSDAASDLIMPYTEKGDNPGQLSTAQGDLIRRLRRNL